MVRHIHCPRPLLVQQADGIRASVYDDPPLFQVRQDLLQSSGVECRPDPTTFFKSGAKDKTLLVRGTGVY
jgi:hypothetical protein